MLNQTQIINTKRYLTVHGYIRSLWIVTCCQSRIWLLTMGVKEARFI